MVRPKDQDFLVDGIRGYSRDSRLAMLNRIGPRDVGRQDKTEADPESQLSTISSLHEEEASGDAKTQ